MASDFSIRHAAHIIRKGGVIAYPTDTIYGLGCDPYNPDAVAELGNIKQRSLDKQFILLAGHIEQLRSLIKINRNQEKTIVMATQATSWIVPARNDTPFWLCRNNTVTIRLCQQSDVQRLCHILGHAIVSTSANLSGKKPANNALELHQRFHYTLDKILASHKRLIAKPSTIIRLRDNQVIRA